MNTSKTFLLLFVSLFSLHLFGQTDSLTQELFDHIRYHARYNIDGRYHEYYETQTLLEAGADVNAVNKKGNSPVHICAKNGDLINLKLLYYYKANLKKKNKDGKTALQIAEESKYTKDVVSFLKKPSLDAWFYAGHGTLEELKVFLKKNMSKINQPSKYGSTMLYYASGRHNDALPTVQYLISQGADVNFGFQDILDISILKEDMDMVQFFVDKNPDELSGRPLNMAIRTKNYDLVKLLIDKGADVNKKDIHGYSPIYYSLIYQKNNQDIIRLLIESGADVNAKDGDKTALFLAVGTRYSDDPDFDYYNYNADTMIVRMLLEAGAVYDIEDRYEETPLTYAMYNKHSAQLLLLFLKYGKNEEINKVYLEDLIFKGARLNDIETIQFCIQNGVDINSTERYGYTALHYALEEPERIPTAEYLIEKGADVNINNENSHNTPLMHAVYRNNTEGVKLLLKNGAAFNKGNKNQLSNMLISVSKYKDNTEIVKLLLESGANVNTVDYSYGTPLDMASKNGNLGTVKLLLEYGADVHLRKTVITPLHYLAENKDAFELVQLLIEKGANADALDGEDRTPLHYAVRSGNQKAIDLIKKHQKKKTGKKRNALMQDRLIMWDKISIDSTNYFGTGDKRDKMDQLYKSMYYDYENINSVNFKDLVYKALMSDDYLKFKNYEPYKAYNENKFGGLHYTLEEVTERYGAGIDTTWDIDPETGETYPLVTEKKANPGEIKGLMFFDEWYLDAEKFRFYKEVKAYGPIRCYERWDDSERPSNRYRILSYFVYDEQKVKSVKKSSVQKMKLFKKIKYEFMLEDEGINYWNAEYYAEDWLSMITSKPESMFWTTYGKEALIHFIFDRVLSGQTKAYDFYTGKSLAVSEIYERFDAGIDTYYDIDPETGMTMLIKFTRPLDYGEVNSVVFIENWYVDTESLYIRKEVVGIAPVRHYFKDDDIYMEERIKKIPFVIYFDETKRF